MWNLNLLLRHALHFPAWYGSLRKNFIQNRVTSEPERFRHCAAGDTMRRKALALFSGGLDSILPVKVIQEQGIEVEAINFTSPFFTCKRGKEGCESDAARAARELAIPLKVIDLGIEFLEVIRKPKHGYGSGMNPCIDCRIFFLRKAGEYLAESGADFIITGEVLGQRPMSQRRDAMRLIERECGLEGLLVRPLSAKHLPATIPEQEGWLDREKLLAISGRSRKEQMRLAEEMGIRDYPNPAGGCLLTEPSFLSKIRDVFDHADQLDPRDFTLLMTGRHFRIGSRTKVVIGRNETDNQALENAAQPDDVLIRWAEGSSPMGVVTGKIEPALLETAAKILLRYTSAQTGVACLIKVGLDETKNLMTVVHSFDEGRVEDFRI
jgi:tRNA-specific 2-thiouridylase